MSNSNFSQIEKTFIRNRAWIEEPSHEVFDLIESNLLDIENSDDFEIALEIFSSKDMATLFLKELYNKILKKLNNLSPSDMAGKILC